MIMPVGNENEKEWAKLCTALWSGYAEDFLELRKKDKFY